MSSYAILETNIAFIIYIYIYRYLKFLLQFLRLCWNCRTTSKMLFSNRRSSSWCSSSVSLFTVSSRIFGSISWSLSRRFRSNTFSKHSSWHWTTGSRFDALWNAFASGFFPKSRRATTTCGLRVLLKFSHGNVQTSSKNCWIGFN